MLRVENSKYGIRRNSIQVYVGINPLLLVVDFYFVLVLKRTEHIAMKMKKSINSRRGGGGNTDASSLAWWKVLFLVSLILLVSFLAHLNYQLVKEIGKPSNGNGDLPEEGGRSSRKDEKRLKSLRQQVSTMKEKVGGIKGKLEMVKKGSGPSGQSR